MLYPQYLPWKIYEASTRKIQPPFCAGSVSTTNITQNPAVPPRSNCGRGDTRCQPIHMCKHIFTAAYLSVCLICCAVKDLRGRLVSSRTTHTKTILAIARGRLQKSRIFATQESTLFLPTQRTSATQIQTHRLRHQLLRNQSSRQRAPAAHFPNPRNRRGSHRNELSFLDMLDTLTTRRHGRPYARIRAR